MFCSDTVSSEIYRPIGFKFYVRHPVVGGYQSYGSYDVCVIFDFIFVRPIFQTLSPLKIVDQLTPNFVSGILGRVSTTVIEIMLIEHCVHFFQLFLHFFSPSFKRYLVWSSWGNWLQILYELSWGGSLPKYRNYADAAILSAERQVQWASFYILLLFKSPDYNLTVICLPPHSVVCCQSFKLLGWKTYSMFFFKAWSTPFTDVHEWILLWFP